MKRRTMVVLLMAGVLTASLAAGAEKTPNAATNVSGKTAKIAGQYKPGHFDGSTFYLVNSSHNDIAYLDDPQGTADFRAEKLIGRALDLMRTNESFTLDVETTLYLKEFLQRWPARLAEVRQRVAENRLSFGGAYTQFYEAVFGGEALARQMYFGRKWLRKTLGAPCDTRIAWDTDVPQRTLQSPQVLAKAGIKYLMVGRFNTPGIHLWESPDGSSVIFDTYLYGNVGGDILYTSKPTPRYVFNLLESQGPLFEQCRLPNLGTVAMGDYTCHGLEVVHKVEEYNRDVEPLRQQGLNPPRMKLATAETFLDSIEKSKPFLKKYTQDRPNPWSYHHQPSHERMVSAGRRGYHELVNAEKFALIASLLDREERPYPHARLKQGWEGLIYPDHGWCGNKTLETMRVFEERLRTAHEVGQEVYQSSMEYITRRIQRNKQAGTALVIFNPLSWARTGPVSARMQFHRGERRPGEMGIVDADGSPVICQSHIESRYADDSVREAAIEFIAADVPSIGYKTYYLSPARDGDGKAGETAKGKVADSTMENRFYRITFGERGIASLIDKESGAEVFDTRKFLANEIFMLGIEPTSTNKYDLFSCTFAAENPRRTLTNFGRLAQPMRVETVESGPIKTVIAMQGTSSDLTVYQTITLYHPIKRIDFSTQLDWQGIRRREVRLAFPIKTADKAQVSYDVPFGVVELGRNEMGAIENERHFTAPREVQNFIEVSDGDRGVSLAVGAQCVHDFRDLTSNPFPNVLVQPVLLSTLLDLGLFIGDHQKDHPWWTQPGHHQFDFALTTHAGAWRENWRFGWEYNNPLIAVVARDLEDADPMIDQYVNSDPFGPRKSVRRERTHGVLPEVYSFCSVEPRNVVISAIKQCDDDDAVVVRYFDMEGKDTDAELKFFRPIKSVEQTNLIEEESKPMAGQGEVLKLSSKRYAIDTIKFSCEPQRKPKP